jgi:circadian clock protein KaiC
LQQTTATDHPRGIAKTPSGIHGLDEITKGGLPKGRPTLICGSAGCGKTLLAMEFLVRGATEYDEPGVFFAFEETAEELGQNVRSLGFDLEALSAAEKVSTRPSLYGLEMHLASMHKRVRAFDPHLVVVDPISNFVAAGSESEAEAMLLRLVDHLKSRQTTAVLVSLVGGGGAREATDQNISSLIDTWVLLRDIELGGERNRGLHVLKSRGTAHSNQVREFVLSSEGVDLLDVYVGADGVLTGSMRLAQEAKEREANEARKQAIARKRREVERKRKALETQILALRVEFDADESELESLISVEEAAGRRLLTDRTEMARSRQADRPGEKS